MHAHGRLWSKKTRTKPEARLRTRRGIRTSLTRAHLHSYAFRAISSRMKLQADLTGVSQNWGYLLGVPTLRLIAFWGLYWSPLILGNYQFTGEGDLQVHSRCFIRLGRQGCPKDQGGYAQIQGSVVSAMKGNQPPKQSRLVSHSHSHQGRLQQLQRSKAQPGGECNLIAAFG